MTKSKLPAFSDIVNVSNDDILKKHINQLAAKITLKNRLDKYINQRIEEIALETEIMLVEHYLQKGDIECPHTDGWEAYLNELKNKLDNLTKESLSDD